MCPQNQKYTSWENPYIELAKNVPERLILARNEELTTAQLEYIKELQQHYAETIIELGSGSGIHLIELAKREPNKLFIGFELRYKRAFKTIFKAQKQEIKNLIVVISDAKKCLSLFDSNSIAGCHINFPDPWDKKRWNKHRLFSKESLLLLLKILKTDGFISYKTDHQEYFNDGLKDLEHVKGFQITNLTRDMYADDPPEQNIATEFEKLFLSKKLPICWLRVTKSEHF